LRDFIARPHHHNPRLKGDAYRSLYYELMDDPDVDPDDLLEVVEGMVEWEGINPQVVFAGGAITLAERTDYYREAEQIARQGVEEARKRIEGRRSMYETEGDYENALNWMTGLMYDALGWVYFQEGRLDDAERELRRAHELYPKERKNLYHLGKLLETRGSVADAEAFYVQGLAVQGRGENPCDVALKELYTRRHGSLDGFETYLAEIRDEERITRKKEILEARATHPQAPPGFELKTIDGEVVGLADLEGKVAVINFWGIWCGWCVIELPDFQKIHERYANDPAVSILTINSGDNPDEVPPWMEEKGFTFPVLFDDGYVNSAAGINLFPTTWFLDRQGRLAFEKEGWSQELIEEFTWRIEALKSEGG
jgi:thiol-disulfide isomerase/thioredoxin